MVPKMVSIGLTQYWSIGVMIFFIVFMPLLQLTFELMLIVVYNDLFAGEFRLENWNQWQMNHGEYKNKTFCVRAKIYAEKRNYGRYV